MPNSPYVTKTMFRNYVRGAIVGFSILLAGVGGGFIAQNQDRANRRAEIAKSNAYQIDAIRTAAVQNCNSLYDAVVNTRSVLEIASDLTSAQYKNDLITEKQYGESKAFYTITINKLKLPDCRKTAALISTNPSTPVPEVEPKHP